MHCNWIIQHLPHTVIVRRAASKWAEGSGALLGSFIKVTWRRNVPVVGINSLGWNRSSPLWRRSGNSGEPYLTFLHSFFFSTSSLVLGLILLKLLCRRGSKCHENVCEHPSVPTPLPLRHSKHPCRCPGSTNHISLINSWLINYLFLHRQQNEK